MRPIAELGIPFGAVATSPAIGTLVAFIAVAPFAYWAPYWGFCCGFANPDGCGEFGAWNNLGLLGVLFILVVLINYAVVFLVVVPLDTLLRRRHARRLLWYLAVGGIIGCAVLWTTVSFFGVPDLRGEADLITYFELLTIPMWVLILTLFWHLANREGKGKIV